MAKKKTGAKKKNNNTKSNANTKATTSTNTTNTNKNNSSTPSTNTNTTNNNKPTTTNNNSTNNTNNNNNTNNTNSQKKNLYKNNQTTKSNNDQKLNAVKAKFDPYKETLKTYGGLNEFLSSYGLKIGNPKDVDIALNVLKDINNKDVKTQVRYHHNSNVRYVYDKKPSYQDSDDYDDDSDSDDGYKAIYGDYYHIINKYGGFLKFLAAYGLKPWEPDDIMKAGDILEHLDSQYHHSDDSDEYNDSEEDYGYEDDSDDLYDGGGDLHQGDSDDYEYDSDDSDNLYGSGDYFNNFFMSALHGMRNRHQPNISTKDLEKYKSILEPFDGFDSFLKSYELDPNDGDEVKKGMTILESFYKKDNNNEQVEERRIKELD